MSFPVQAAGVGRPPVVIVSFATAVIVTVALVLSDPFLSSFVSARVWQRLHLGDSPVRISLFAAPFLALVSVALHFMLRADDAHRLLIVLMTIAMQTNAVRLLGLDLLSVLPFVVLMVVLAECLLQPALPIQFTALSFVGLFLLLLDLPHMMDPHIYGPARFIINMLSLLKSMLVGVVMILLIRDQRDLQLALRSLLIVGLVSAAIGVGQILLNKFTGISLTLALESGEVKPTFLGTALRASALTSWAQHLADFQIIAYPFFLSNFLSARNWRRVLGWGLAVALSLGAVFYTFTYAAYVAVVLITLLVPFFVWPQRCFHFLLTILLSATVFYMFGGWHWLFEKGVTRFTSSSGFVERNVYMQAALAEIMRDPWTGLGLYTDEELSGNFFRKRVHNTGLQAWVYFGLPGLLVFIGGCLTVHTQSWLMATIVHGPQRRMFLCLCAAMTAAFLAMFAQPNLSLPATWYLLGLSSAAVRVHRHGRGAAENSTRRQTGWKRSPA